MKHATVHAGQTQTDVVGLGWGFRHHTSNKGLVMLSPRAMDHTSSGKALGALGHGSGFGLSVGSVTSGLIPQSVTFLTSKETPY